jgi:hypothetical protein
MDDRIVYNPEKVKRKLFMFLANEVAQGMVKFPKNIDLKLLCSHIHFAKLDNQFKAVFELMNCQNCSPSLQERFYLFKGKFDIQ